MKFLDEAYLQLELFEFEREELFADIKPGELSYQERAKIRAVRNFVRYLLHLQRRRQKEGKDKAVRCKFDERCLAFPD